MTPQQYCRDKAARSGSSFYYSFLFLPQPQRDAIMALYAFCREVDDAVDEIARIGGREFLAHVDRLIEHDPWRSIGIIDQFPGRQPQDVSA